MTEHDGLLVGEPDRLDAIVAALREFPGWPADDAKDREFAYRLTRAYPGLDLDTEVQAWLIWMLDHEPKGKGVKVRARFSNWCRNAVRYGGTRGTSTSNRAARGKAGTRARTADEFGGTSDRASGW